MSRLSRRIYCRPTIAVARRLLGCHLVTRVQGVVTAGKIVETEAYHGDIDPACHCYHRRTARNEVMFHAPGSFYVYLIYGMHFCVNLVTEEKDTGAAVLIRAIEPVVGTVEMYRRRSVKKERDLTNGPAKLCKALGICGEFSGEHLADSNRLWIEQKPALKEDAVVATTRIGISKAKELPWRFYVRESEYVSRQ